ncbi:MAG: HAD-IC family P-type ATPase [Bdellovibrionales bacterium]|nr:HAD-IC family P-type ATPase [Bdellovibrionales bacterium]
MNNRLSNDVTSIVPLNNLIGLNTSQVESQVRLYGYNEILIGARESILVLVFKTLKEPMILLMLIVVAFYFLLGEFKEAMVLSTSVLFVIALSLYQEKKAKDAIDSLRELSSPKAVVIRNSKEQIIATRELVPNDIILLKEGDRIPADAILIEANSLHIDESLLTGESAPVIKNARLGTTDRDESRGENKSQIFMGTMVVGGRGKAVVTETAQKTILGKIGKSAQATIVEGTNLNKEVRKIVRNFAFMGAIIAVILVVVVGVRTANWSLAILNGLALELALLPEEFPVVLTIFMALGAWRLSKV